MTIVAVLPRAFDFPDGTDIWIPATAVASPSVTQRTANNIRAIGRLKRDVTLAAASVEMTSIARRLEQADPQSHSGKGVALTPLLDDTERVKRATVSARTVRMCLIGVHATPLAYGQAWAGD